MSLLRVKSLILITCLLDNGINNVRRNCLLVTWERKSSMGTAIVPTGRGPVMCINISFILFI